MLIKTAIVSTAIIGGLAIPAPAHADQYDFIAALDNQGVAYNNILGMIELGKETCHELRAGTSIDAMIDYLVSNRGFPQYEAGFIIGAAARDMCPDAGWRLSQYLNGSPTSAT